MAKSSMHCKLVLGNRLVMFGLIIAEVGIVMVMSFKQRTISAGTASAAFLVYSFLNGLTLSVIFFVYASASITLAFAVASSRWLRSTVSIRMLAGIEPRSMLLALSKSKLSLRSDTNSIVPADGCPS